MRDSESVPIHLKLTLSIKEASEYSNIGINNFFSSLTNKLCFTCFTQSIFYNSTHITGTALIQFFLSNLTISQVTNNLVFIHRILATKNAL